MQIWIATEVLGASRRDRRDAYPDFAVVRGHPQRMVASVCDRVGGLVECDCEVAGRSCTMDLYSGLLSPQRTPDSD